MITPQNIEKAIAFVSGYLEKNWANFGIAGEDLIDIWQLKLSHSDKRNALFYPFNSPIAKHCENDAFTGINEVLLYAIRNFNDYQKLNIPL